MVFALACMNRDKFLGSSKWKALQLLCTLRTCPRQRSAQSKVCVMKAHACLQHLAACRWQALDPCCNFDHKLPARVNLHFLGEDYLISCQEACLAAELACHTSRATADFAFHSSVIKLLQLCLLQPPSCPSLPISQISDIDLHSYVRFKAGAARWHAAKGLQMQSSLTQNCVVLSQVDCISTKTSLPVFCFCWTWKWRHPKVRSRAVHFEPAKTKLVLGGLTGRHRNGWDTVHKCMVTSDVGCSVEHANSPCILLASRGFLVL